MGNSINHLLFETVTDVAVPGRVPLKVRSSIRSNMRFIMRFPPRSKKARKANTPVSLLAQIYVEKETMLKTSSH